MTFHEACRAIDRNCPNPYARAYARAGLRAQTRDEMEVQSLYIMSNLAHWRGPLAAEVKTALRNMTGVK
jgi:hypothetical protein